MIWFTKAKPTPKMNPKPKGGKKATLDKLNSFLVTAEPETVEFLVSFWNTQAQGVTYKELREAYLSGGITEEQFTKWQKDYSKLVTSTLAPKWQQAADLAAAEVKAQYPYFVYEPSISASINFIKQHGAELVTNLAQEQKDALNAIIAHVSGYTAITPDEAARIMRPVIGLTKPQAVANARYRESVKEAYLKAHPHGKPETAEKKAADAAAKYAARQHRYRAQSIARTELAYGYNAGAYGATKDAQAQGYIGDCVKVWLTAYDERVCPICSLMDDEKRNMDELFSNGKMLPPGHPQCRCAVAYKEIPETNLNPGQDDRTLDSEILGQYTGERLQDEMPKDSDLIPIQEIETSEEESQYYKPVEIDRNDTSPINRGEVNTTARKLKTANNNIYVSDNVKLKPKQLHNIDKNISEALKKLGVSENKNLPTIFIINNAEMQTGALASYNAVKNVLYLDQNTGILKNLLELQKDCACPDNELSTFVHEFIHWKDADEYRRKFGKITDNTKYKMWLNQKCKKKLDKLEKKGYDVNGISGYASTMLEKDKFDEVYTEFRVKEFLRR